MFQAVRIGAKLKETGENDDIESFIKKNSCNSRQKKTLEKEGLTVREMIKCETMKLRRAYNFGKGGLRKHLLFVKNTPELLLNVSKRF